MLHVLEQQTLKYKHTYVAANPGGVGATWHFNRYIEPSESNTSFTGTDGLTRKFIPAKLADNPYLANDGVYEQMLKSLPPIQRRQLLEDLIGKLQKVLHL